MWTLLTPVIVRISRFTSCLTLLPLEQGMCIKIIHALVVQRCIGRYLCWGTLLVENVKKDYSCGGACRRASFTNLRTSSFRMAVFLSCLVGSCNELHVKIYLLKRARGCFEPAFRVCPWENKREDDTAQITDPQTWYKSIIVTKR